MNNSDTVRSEEMDMLLLHSKMVVLILIEDLLLTLPASVAQYNHPHNHFYRYYYSIQMIRQQLNRHKRIIYMAF